MRVELLDYTKNGIHKIASMTRATRKNELDMKWFKDETYKGIKETFNSDDEYVKALIGYGHLGVLEHINFTFHVSEISRCLSHQLVRHRLASYLQMSIRHTKPTEDGYIIPTTIRNMKVEVMKNGKEVCKELIKHAYDSYQYLINNGVPIEDARYVLPPAFYTHISFTINGRNLLHLLELRLHNSTQWEFREMACRLFDEVYSIYPILFESVKELRDKNETS